MWVRMLQYSLWVRMYSLWVRMYSLWRALSQQMHPAIVPLMMPTEDMSRPKKREYGQRVRGVEHGVFTPLVLSTNGGMGKEATTFYKRLAVMIAQKRQHW